MPTRAAPRRQSVVTNPRTQIKPVAKKPTPAKPTPTPPPATPALRPGCAHPGAHRRGAQPTATATPEPPKPPKPPAHSRTRNRGGDDPGSS